MTSEGSAETFWASSLLRKPKKHYQCGDDQKRLQIRPEVEGNLGHPESEESTHHHHRIVGCQPMSESN